MRLWHKDLILVLPRRQLLGHLMKGDKAND